MKKQNFSFCLRLIIGIQTILLSSIASASPSSSPFSMSQQIEFVDILDHAKFSNKHEHIKHLPTHTLLRAMKLFPQEFFSPVENGAINPELYQQISLKRIYLNDALNIREQNIGPTGKEVIATDGSSKYKIDDSEEDSTRKNQQLRRNTVFGIELEAVRENSQSSYESDIIAFMHDEQSGYYFRRMTVVSNLTYERKDPRKVIVKQWHEDIPLLALKFSISVDILQRKLILQDSVYGITKIYPIGVGALNMKTLDGMDGTINSMTPTFPQDSYLTKNPYNVQNKLWLPNFRERTSPSYYRGRPFIGIAHRGNDGNYSYKGIGLHYQIDEEGLKRGFVSHGCIRVRDKDLYELEAIVFEGAQAKIPIVVQNSLPLLAHIKHPYPQLNKQYMHVAYYRMEGESLNIDFWEKKVKDYIKQYRNTLRETKANDPWFSNPQATWLNRYTWCRAHHGSGVSLRQQSGYTSILDNDCLTKTTLKKDPTQSVSLYLQKLKEAQLDYASTDSYINIPPPKPNSYILNTNTFLSEGNEQDALPAVITDYQLIKAL